MILVFSNEIEAQDALNRINANIGCPFYVDDYYMETWAKVNKAVNDDIWWINKPTDRLYGTNYYTTAEVMSGITNYTEQFAPDSDWLPTPLWV